MTRWRARESGIGNRESGLGNRRSDSVVPLCRSALARDGTLAGKRHRAQARSYREMRQQTDAAGVRGPVR
ncbi:hypothetical protein E1J29_19340 [Xanthomonas hortorum pv. vitians]|nr:hypothetical protein [Xanthomonas hortorum pv. vitians]NMI45397.1 hypothetical protein [Xanthomonas hortorum pv. vitians]